jgi:nicotinamide-nucleotide amidase
MMTDELLPRIKRQFRTLDIYHKVVKTSGIGESWLSDKIAPWEDQLPDHIKLAYLPSVLEVKLRLTASGSDKEQLKEDVEVEIKKLKTYIQKYIFGYNKDTIESVLGEKLLELNLTISTAESCTGGFLAHKITSVSGSSSYFTGSIISYDNRIKEEVLRVSGNTLDVHGAVSEQTVKEMASGIRKQFKTNIGVATSGIAGPTGGTEEKPVGTIWIAVSDSNGTETKLLHLAKNRQINIEASSKAAMDLVLQRLKKIN